jgi:Fic family protein
MPYIWEHPDWPAFHFDAADVRQELERADKTWKELTEELMSAGFEIRQTLALNSLAAEVLKSAEIENELYSAEAVRSSIARKIGMDPWSGGQVNDKRAEAFIEILLEATRNYQVALTEVRIKEWHRTFLSGVRGIDAGEYRQGEIAVVSGNAGRENVHFEAPPPDRVATEMDRFFSWTESVSDTVVHPLVKSAIAHLWFVTIHPFEDGNGRIGRVVGELFLARSERSSSRYYSFSSALHQKRKEYYGQLEQAQKGRLDVTQWILWSLKTVQSAMTDSIATIRRTIENNRVWKLASGGALNSRQSLMLPRLLEEFRSGINSSTWASICRCSQDTAARDMEGLVRLGILVRGSAGGRSTRYLVSPKEQL